MTKRTLATAPLLAALALGGSVVGASAQEPTDTPPDASAVGVTDSTGTVELITDANGRDRYYLRLEDDRLVELSYGPSWFWGPLSPLSVLVGQTVTIGGNLRDGQPDEHASDTALENATKDAALKVKTVDGERLKGQGKPAWAGGPKTVGEVHPGYEGWSRGQAAKAGAKAAKAEAGAAKAEAKAAKAEAKAAKAAAKSNR